LIIGYHFVSLLSSDASGDVSLVYPSGEIHPEVQSLLDRNWNDDSNTVLGLSLVGVSKQRGVSDLDWTQILAGSRQYYIWVVDHVASDVDYPVSVVVSDDTKDLPTCTDVAFWRKGDVDNHNKPEALRNQIPEHAETL
jgi:hypothetical protein